MPSSLFSSLYIQGFESCSIAIYCMTCQQYFKSSCQLQYIVMTMTCRNFEVLYVYQKMFCYGNLSRECCNFMWNISPRCHVTSRHLKIRSASSSEKRSPVSSVGLAILLSWTLNPCVLRHMGKHHVIHQWGIKHQTFLFSFISANFWDSIITHSRSDINDSKGIRENLESSLYPTKWFLIEF